MTVSAVNSNAKKNYPMKKFHLTDNQGETWEIDIDHKMNPAKVEHMVKDTIVTIAKIIEDGLQEKFDLKNNWTLLFYIEILKKYTSLEIKNFETAEKSISAYVNLANSLMALDLDRKILECFDEKARERTTEEFLKGITEMSNIVSEATKQYVGEQLQEISQTEEVEN